MPVPHHPAACCVIENLDTLTTGVDATHAELEDFTSNKASSKTETSNTQWAVFIEDRLDLSPEFIVQLFTFSKAE